MAKDKFDNAFFGVLGFLAAIPWVISGWLMGALPYLILLFIVIYGVFYLVTGHGW